MLSAQGLCLGRSRTALPRPTAVSLQGEFGAYRRRKSDTSHFATLGASPTGYNRRKGKLIFF